MKIKTTRSENNNPKKIEGTEAEGRKGKARYNKHRTSNVE